ncbi:MAG: bifunctional demethylmenaquinone methyltransferase/2-methoxy-6-polyprenyl-1,4-benzoquinol methylase UbiE [Alistipes sp.]|jgi:demethylmenaquinone methyltransferase/2-methoxy-6-polyprenyl-1,4-benzoquinol methylase|nr:bifunctional demethylmenaquinone methyltransferase/2-methoxy-6-polyprenyl-1,4-benzoquinol methylase UbiE [Alistipes sp.]
MTGAVSKKEFVGGMFDAIAPTYDALNHFLSLGIDRLWRRRVVRMVSRASLVGTAGDEAIRKFTILDVATGTGDLVISLARRIAAARIVGVDISEGMLARGREKVARCSLSGRIVLQPGDAEALEFPDSTFDAVTVAFGVRNFGDIDSGLREMQRVLRPGGRCFVLEFSEPRGALFGPVYRFYFHRVLPWLGRLVSRDRGAYSYLPRSVDEFPAPERFAAMLREAGFAAVRVRRLSLGIAYVYEAEK